jgi:hypothetical protein
MRIATANAFDIGIDTLTSRQADLSDAQDPAAQRQAGREGQRRPGRSGARRACAAGILRSDTSQRAVDAARTAMSQTETALADAASLLQQAREGSSRPATPATASRSGGRWPSS